MHLETRPKCDNHPQAASMPWHCKRNDWFQTDGDRFRKMGEESVDISVIEYFKTGQSLDKKNKRKILDLFKFLGGGESPTEAVELTVRRNWNLREAQLKAVYEMVKLVENPPCLVSFERKTFPDFLSLRSDLYNLLSLWYLAMDFRVPGNLRFSEI